MAKALAGFGGLALLRSRSAIAADPATSPCMINVYDYGAGRGAADDSAAINRAIADMKLKKIGWLHFPAGNYRIAKPILLGNDVIGSLNGVLITGHGESSRIVIDDPNQVAFQIGDSTKSTNGCSITDLMVICSKLDPKSSGIGIAFVNVTDIRVDRVRVRGHATGISFVGCHKINVDNTRVDATHTGIYTQCDLRLSHCGCIGGGVYGLVMDGSEGLRATTVALFGQLSLTTRNTIGNTCGNSIWAWDLEANYERNHLGDGCPLPDLPVEGAGSLNLAYNATEVHLIDCWLQDGVVIGTLARPSYVFVRGCEFNAHARGLSDQALKIVSAKSVMISGNSFVGLKQAPSLQLGDGSGAIGPINVSGNNFVANQAPHCLTLQASCDQFSIQGNIFTGYAETAASFPDQSNHIVANNIE